MSAVRLLLACLAAALVAAASAAAATRPQSPVRATMSTTSTAPLVDTPWRYTLVVQNRRGKPLRAKARLHVLLGALVIGCWKSGRMQPCSSQQAGTWIPFTGRRTGALRWRAQSVGVRLTFQATVVAMGRSLKLRAPVTVKQP